MDLKLLTAGSSFGTKPHSCYKKKKKNKTKTTNENLEMCSCRRKAETLGLAAAEATESRLQLRRNCSDMFLYCSPSVVLEKDRLKDLF